MNIRPDQQACVFYQSTVFGGEVDLLPRISHIAPGLQNDAGLQIRPA